MLSLMLEQAGGAGFGQMHVAQWLDKLYSPSHMSQELTLLLDSPDHLQIILSIRPWQR